MVAAATVAAGGDDADAECGGQHSPEHWVGSVISGPPAPPPPSNTAPLTPPPRGAPHAAPTVASNQPVPGRWRPPPPQTAHQKRPPPQDSGPAARGAGADRPSRGRWRPPPLKQHTRSGPPRKNPGQRLGGLVRIGHPGVVGAPPPSNSTPEAAPPARIRACGNDGWCGSAIPGPSAPPPPQNHVPRPPRRAAAAPPYPLEDQPSGRREATAPRLLFAPTSPNRAADWPRPAAPQPRPLPLDDMRTAAHGTCWRSSTPGCQTCDSPQPEGSTREGASICADRAGTAPSYAPPPCSALQNVDTTVESCLKAFKRAAKDSKRASSSPIWRPTSRNEMVWTISETK